VNRYDVARAARSLAILIAAAAAGGATAWLIGHAAAAVSGNRYAPWIVGRASGITAYLLLVALVAMGLLLAHPWRTRIRRPSSVARIRAHVALAGFTLVFTLLHIVVLATDRYAGVGWRGALLPLGASYRPVPVTLGVIGLYAGLISGLTTALAGRVGARVWWPLHRLSSVTLVLVWAHGVLAGSDTIALLAMYVITGGAVLALGVSRYVATTPADRIEAQPATVGRRPLVTRGAAAAPRRAS